MPAVLTDAGKAILANRVKGNGTEPLYLAWGTGTTDPTAADTGLEAEDVSGGYSRSAGVSSIVTVHVDDDTYQVSGSLVASDALQITEWGLFDASVNGNLLFRETSLPGFTLALGGILNFVIKIQMSECEA